MLDQGIHPPPLKGERSHAYTHPHTHTRTHVCAHIHTQTHAHVRCTHNVAKQDGAHLVLARKGSHVLGHCSNALQRQELQRWEGAGMGEELRFRACWREPEISWTLAHARLRGAPSKPFIPTPSPSTGATPSAAPADCTVLHETHCVPSC